MYTSPSIPIRSGRAVTKYFRRYKVNMAFFDTWSPAMAWVLGLYLTDGTISSNGHGQTMLTSCDVDILEKARNHLDSEHPISPDKHSRALMLQINSVKLVDRLAELGVVPRKSFTVQAPQCPPEMWPHLLRGIWDGDGTVGVYDGVLRAGFVSASQGFAEAITSYIAGLGVRCYLRVDKQPLWRLTLSGQWALQLCDIMYANSAQETRMDRKYKIYIDFLDWHGPYRAGRRANASLFQRRLR